MIAERIEKMRFADAQMQNPHPENRRERHPATQELADVYTWVYI
jgi:hypothetical protein